MLPAVRGGGGSLQRWAGATGWFCRDLAGGFCACHRRGFYAAVWPLSDSPLSLWFRMLLPPVCLVVASVVPLYAVLELAG